jgi:hypothetical protein
MSEWMKQVDLDIPSFVKYGRQFNHLSDLMQHCNSKTDVYHQGFKEYVGAMAELWTNTDIAPGWPAHGRTKRHIFSQTAQIIRPRPDNSKYVHKSKMSG